MLDKFKQQAVRQGMKVLSSPKVAQLMADPRLMSAIMKGLELKGRVQSEIEGRVRSVASALSLATRADLDDVAYDLRQDLQRNLTDLEARYAELQQQLRDGDESNGADTTGH
jgi:hypothetical protein